MPIYLAESVSGGIVWKTLFEPEIPPVETFIEKPDLLEDHFSIICKKCGAIGNYNDDWLEDGSRVTCTRCNNTFDL